MKKILSSATALILLSACSQSSEKISELVLNIEQRQAALLAIRENDLKRVIESWLYQKTACPTIFVTPENHKLGNYREIVQIHPVTIGDAAKWSDSYYQKPTYYKANMVKDSLNKIWYSYHPVSSFTWDILLDEIRENSLECENETQRWWYWQVWLTHYISWTEAIKPNIQKP